MPETVIRDDVYPPFCSGVGYLISKSALKLLLQKPIEKSWLKALKNEDVIFTGYLREKSAIPFVHTDNVIRFKVFNVANCDKFLISAHQYNSPDEMIRFWSKFQSQMQDC